MSKLQVTDMLARAFAAEGVDTLFTLMGDANMYWSVATAQCSWCSRATRRWRSPAVRILSA